MGEDEGGARSGMICLVVPLLYPKKGNICKGRHEVLRMWSFTTDFITKKSWHGGHYMHHEQEVKKKLALSSLIHKTVKRVKVSRGTHS